MRNLFRSFEREKVRYLLISGQASVLYGAALFSEDIDLWVDPDPGNIARVLRGLANAGARVYKLTPPLQPNFLRRGHGFHFICHSRGGNPAYIDILGKPPRARSFQISWRRSRSISTPWGKLPVVSPEDLVEIKKTRRLADYEVISNLVERRLAESSRPDRRLLRWALANSFRAEDLWTFARRLSGGPPPRRPAVRTIWSASRRSEEPGEKLLKKCLIAINREIAELQARDIAYWRPILAELRVLKKENRLLRAGTTVRSLLMA